MTVLVYILATVLACVFAWRAERSERKWPWLVAAALPLLLVAACRWDVGTDFYYVYYPVFKSMELHKAGLPADVVDEVMGPLLERWKLNPFGDVATGSAMEFCKWYYRGGFCVQEPGYRMLEEFCSWAGLGFRGVIALTSLLTGFLVVLAVKRQSTRYVAAFAFFVLLGNYFRSLNMIRQYVAIGFALVSVEFIVERRPLRFLACILAGALFHRSILLMVPCYLFAHMAISPKVTLAMVLVALAASPLIRPFIGYVPRILPLGRYAGYFNPALWTQAGFQWVFFANGAVFLAWGAYCWKTVCERNRHFPVWYSMTALGEVALAFSGTLPAMNRVCYLLTAPQFLMVAELLAAEYRPWLRKPVVFGAYGIFAFGCLFRFWVMNSSETMPYNVSRQPDDRLIRRVSRAPFGWRLPGESAK